MNKLRIGLQTHVMIKSQMKLFCRCRPNTQECEICRAVPGSLPLPPSPKLLLRLNQLIDLLKGNINEELTFSRKHYSYHDLPAGYQRTQKASEAYAFGGKLKLLRCNQQIPISQIYLEEDPAATFHKGVDYKRAGNPLLEIVTPPIFQGTSDELRKPIHEYLLTLEKICLDLNLSSKNKCLKTDVNVSLWDKPSIRYQIKNLSSHSDVFRAIRESVNLLLQEKEGNKTFHYKNKLIYSRPKTSYLFAREWNLPPIENKKVMKRDHLVLYELLAQLRDKGSWPLVYSYAKLIHQKVKDPIEVKKLLKLDLKEGYKTLKCEVDPKLKAFVIEHLSKSTLTRVSFEGKDSDFRFFISNLKKDLSKLGYNFTSLTLNSIIDSYIHP